MRIYIPELRQKKDCRAEYIFEDDLERLYDDFSAGGEIKVQMSVVASGDKIVVKGKMTGYFKADCVKCLSAFLNDFETEFFETFNRRPVSEEGLSDKIMAEETANTLYFSGDYLYLDEYFRQLIVLTQDMKPTCKHDCKGLCQYCGANLNEGLCDCDLENKNIDVRFLKLKELKADS